MLAGFHAGLVDAISEHVIFVSHDDAAKLVAILDNGIADDALLALNVQFNTSRVVLLDNRADRLKTVLRNVEERATQCVEMSDGLAYWREP